jgi:hypothetical protein
MEIRVPRAHENVGSNPTTLTGKHCGGIRAGTGPGAPGLTVTTQVRFLSPQLEEWKSSGWMRGLPRKQVSRRIGIVGSSPTASALKKNMCLWPIGRGVSFPSWTGGFDSRRALLIGSVAQRQSRCLLSTRAWVRVPPVPLSFRGRFCWKKSEAFNLIARRSPSAFICPVRPAASVGGSIPAPTICELLYRECVIRCTSNAG